VRLPLFTSLRGYRGEWLRGDVIAGLLRLGFLANFISEPVLKGFIGLALTIVAGQLPKLFGVESGEGDFFQKLWDLLTRLEETSGATLLVGAVSLALVLGLRRFAPAVPGSPLLPAARRRDQEPRILAFCASNSASLSTPCVFSSPSCLSWASLASMSSAGAGAGSGSA